MFRVSWLRVRVNLPSCHECSYVRLRACGKQVGYGMAPLLRFFTLLQRGIMSQQHSRLAPTEDFATPDQDPSEPPESNCPLYCSLNSRHPSFFIKCSDNVLKTMAASAPSHLKECLTSSANRDTLINQVLLLRHEEAVEFYICTKTAHYWLQKLLLMEVKLLRSMASFNPSSLRAMMKSALMADLRIQPRVLPSNSEGLVITFLT